MIDFCLLRVGTSDEAVSFVSTASQYLAEKTEGHSAFSSEQVKICLESWRTQQQLLEQTARVHNKFRMYQELLPHFDYNNGKTWDETRQNLESATECAADAISFWTNQILVVKSDPATAVQSTFAHVGEQFAAGKCKGAVLQASHAGHDEL